MFYTGIFPRSRIVDIARYSHVGQEIHGRPPGSVMTVAFELDGQPFTAPKITSRPQLNARWPQCCKK